MQDTKKSKDQLINEINELRSSLRLKENMLESIGQGVIAVDKNRKIIFWNKYAENIFGWKKDEVLDKPIVEITPSEEAYGEAREMIELVMKGKRWSGELKVKSKNGRKFPADVTAAPVFDEHGNLNAVISITKDIAERKAEINRLKESEEYASAAAEASPALTYIYDFEKKGNVWSNKRHKKFFKKLTSNTRNELKFEELENYIHPDDFNKLIRESEKLMIGDKEKIVEQEIRFKMDDGWLWMAHRSNVFKTDETGRVIQIIGSMINIDDKKKFEQQLIDEKFKLTEYFENLPLMAYNISFEGIIDDINNTAVHTLGYDDKDELIGKKLIETIYPPEMQGKARKLMEDWKKDFKIINKEIQVVKRNGEKIDVLLNVDTIFDEKGTPLYSLSTQLDITPRKKAENLLKQSEERFKQLFDRMGDGVAIYEPVENGNNFVIVDINKAGQKLSRIKKEDVIDKKVTEAFPAVKEIGLFDVFKSVYKTGKSKSHPLKLYKDNRIEEWVENYVYKLPSGQIAAIYKDTSKEQIALQELKESEKLLSEIGEIARVGGWYVNLQSRTVYWTRAARLIHEEPLDYEPTLDEALEYFPGESGERLSKAIDMAINYGKEYDLELEFISAKGNKLWTRAIGKPKMKNGECVELRGTFQDITWQKQARDEIEAGYEKLETTLNSIGDAVITTDIYGNIESMNPVAELLTGWDELDAIGKPLDKALRLINEFSRETVKSPFNEVIEKGKVVGLANHTILISKAGNEIPIADSGAPIVYENGNIGGVVLVFRDQTEERQAEKALKESEEKYRTVFENAHAGIYRTRYRDGKLLMANQYMAEFFGYNNPEEAIGDYITSQHYVEPGTREKMISIIDKKGYFDNFEAAITTIDGEVKWLQYSGRLNREESYIEGVAIDITERKAAEESLKERNVFIQTVLDNLPIGIAMNRFDDGAVIYINKKFEEIYGWPEVDLKDIPDFFQKVYPDEKYRQEIMTRVMADIQSKDPSRMKWKNNRITRKSGEEAIIDAENIPLLEQNTMVSTVIDVTKERIAHKAMVESEEKYRSLFNAISDAILIIDSVEKTIVDVNGAFSKLYGYERNEIIGKDAVSLSAEERESLNIIDKSNKEQNIEIPLRYHKNKTGEIFPVEIKVSGFKSSKRKFISAIIRDISNRLENEQKIKNAHKQLRNFAVHLQDIREDERKAIARELHDEMGHTLTAMKINLSYIEKIMADAESKDDLKKLEDEIISMKDITINSIKRLKQLIRELRPEVLEEFPILDALQWLISEFLNRSGIMCSYNFEVKDLKMSKSKELALFRILQESLHNVMKHSEARNVIIRISVEDNMLRMEVSDDGIGFDENRVDSTRSFGLIGINERIIAAGGHMQIDSIPGGGTKILAFVPVND